MGEMMMSKKEAELASLLDRHLEGSLKLEDVAQRAGLGIRQIIRKKKAYLAEGPKGLLSKKRDNTSNRAYPAETRALVLSFLSEDRMEDFGPTFAAEILQREKGLLISHETIRQWMIEWLLWDDKRRRRTKVYQRRERRSRFGALIQLDGSHHDWFEGRGPKCTLLLAIDDATGKLTSGRFEKEETTVGYFRLMKAHIERYGRPLALYPDKYSVFKVNQKTALLNETQFTKAMRQLSIDVICAHSPQAKGRIERSFKTHQDRLIKEMRLQGISSIEGANEFLESYISKHNKQFSKAAKDPADAHEPLNPNQDLQRILACHNSRKVTKNLEISWKGQILQIQAPGKERRLIKNQVDVIETIEGELLIEFGGEMLEWRFYKELPAEPAPVADVKQIADAAAGRERRGRHTSKNHPWRRPRYKPPKTDSSA